MYKSYNSNFEFTRKRILIKNPNLDFFFDFLFEGGGWLGDGVSDGGIGGLTGKK